MRCARKGKSDSPPELVGDLTVFSESRDELVSRQLCKLPGGDDFDSVQIGK
jgi:hypothetical protein